jgi:DNA-binding PadR family transcriptional regulator
MGPKEIDQSLIRLSVLIQVSKEPIDSAGLFAKLHERGLAIDTASMRRILHAFERKGYLVSREAGASRTSVTYAITRAGRRQSRDAREKLVALLATFGSRSA